MPKQPEIGQGISEHCVCRVAVDVMAMLFGRPLNRTLATICGIPMNHLHGTIGCGVDRLDAVAAAVGNVHTHGARFGHGGASERSSGISHTYWRAIVRAFGLEAIDGLNDLMRVATKSYNLVGTIEDFGTAAGPETAILPVLNGLRHLDRLTPAHRHCPP